MPGADPTPPTARPVARPISDAEAANMLGVVAGPLPAAPVVAGFRFPASALPAPRPGVEAIGTLHADGGRVPVPAIDEPGAPRIVFTGPRGEAAVTSQISVLFSRPMASLDRLDEVPAGLSLEPDVAGDWRWLDPSTLVFDVAAGLPRGRVYTVDVPAGITAPDGEVLARGARWSFTTPPPTIVRVTHVRGTDPSQPMIGASFDQNVDPDAILPYLSMRVEGRDYEIEVVPDAVRDTMNAIRSLTSMPNRLVVIRPTSRFDPGDPAVAWSGVLRLDAGAPSDQGPVRTTEPAEHEFSIAKSLRVVAHGCGRAPRCAPGTVWTVEFNHPPRRQTINDAVVRIEPALPGATVEVWSNYLLIMGAPEANTTYTVQLDPSIESMLPRAGGLGTVPPLQFQIGTPTPALWTPGSGLALLDPVDSRYLVLTEGLDSIRVHIRAVSPTDWHDYTSVLGSPPGEGGSLPGRTLSRAVAAVMPVAGGPGEAAIDLEAALAEAGGHVLLEIEPAGPERSAFGDTDLPHLLWVQRGDAMVDVSIDIAKMTARVTNRTTGAPLSGAVLRLFREDQSTADTPIASAITDRDGIATLDADLPSRGFRWLLTAEHAGLTTVVPSVLPGRNDCAISLEELRSGVYSGTGCGSNWSAGLRTHTVLDRPIYSPGDTARFAIFLRTRSGFGLEPVAPPPGTEVAYRVTDARAALIGDGVLEVGPNGLVEAAVPLAPGTNAGNARIQLEVPSPDGSDTPLIGRSGFQVADVLRPNFEVDVEVEPGPHTPGSVVSAEVSADYFTGGPVPGAEVTWRVRSEQARYVPPGISGYSFSPAYARVRWVEPTVYVGRTDSNGAHGLLIMIDSLRPARPMLLVAEATVTDLDQVPRTASASTVVHAADAYVGLRTPSRLARSGETVLIEGVVVDIEGRPLTGRPVTVEAVRQEPISDANGENDVRLVSQATCAVESGPDPLTCRFESLPAGDYLIIATVADALGRTNTTELSVRIAAETIPAGARAVADTLSLATDLDEYEPGDTAHLRIATSLAAADALLTVRRAGIHDVRVVRLQDGLATVDVPITDVLVPNVALHVKIAGADGAAVTRSTTVAVSSVLRRLNVTVSTREPTIEPGATTTVSVAVTDHRGQPVPNADVVLTGIDEALIALSRYAPADPIADIYPRTSEHVEDQDLRAHITPRPRPDAASTSPEDQPAGTGTIEGVVLDGLSGRPVRNAWVEVETEGAGGNVGKGGWTGIDGRYSITGVTAGEQLLLARAGNYVTTAQGGLVVPAGGVARSNFVVLTRQAVIEGRRVQSDPRAITIDAGRAMLFPGGQGGIVLRTALATAEPPPPLGRGGYVDLPWSTYEAWGYNTDDPDSFVRYQEPAPLRRNFTPVAAFTVGAHTGPDGRVDIDIEAPDNLTRYRLRAVVAESDRRFGTGESTLTANRDVMLRAGAPRFLSRGDRFELPVMIENRSDTTMDLAVATRAVNATADGPAGQRVTVPANDRVEVRFPFIAGEPGEARFQMAVGPDAEGVEDAAEVAVPVLLPAVTETFATYGELYDANAVAYPLELPTGALPGQSHVELGFSTTATHGLHDALLFLINCYYDVPEVYASRIIALSALRGTYADSAVGAAIDATIYGDLTRLGQLQLNDGSWAVWSPQFDDDPFLTVHAANALAHAQDAGVSVPEHTLAQAHEWLRRLDEWVPLDGPSRPAVPISVNYPIQARRAIQAYALDVRRRLGDDVSASAAALLRESGPAVLTVEALAWLLPSLASYPAYAAEADEVRRAIESRLVRSAGTAAFVSPYSAGGRYVFYSPRRSDAVALAALVADGYDDATVAALARGLMAHRAAGRWSNTQENAFAVAALTDYLASAEATEPDLVARAWLGPRLASEQSFEGRSDVRFGVRVPSDSLGPPGSDQRVTIAREGAGRLYYRVGVSYAGLDRPATARGFEVSRRYEAIDNPSDVRQDEDGTWRIRLGARVRIRVRVAAAGPRHHVAVIDPLPAGFMAVDPTLAGTEGSFRPGARQTAAEFIRSFAPTSGYSQFLAEHVNVRDQQFEAFARTMQPGRREFTYIALATVAGDFVAPAPRAEEIYAPETYGRGDSGRVIIEDQARN